MEIRTEPAAPSTNLERAGYSKSGRVRCYNCGQMGHISYDCRQPQVRKACYLCGNPGHVSRDCPQRVRVLVCFSCKKTGHMSFECPERSATASEEAATRGAGSEGGN